MKTGFIRLLCTLVVMASLSAPAQAQQLPAPEQFFGFPIGADG